MKDKIEAIIAWSLSIIFYAILIFGIIKCCSLNNNNTPVEECNNSEHIANSIIKVNDSIKLKVKQLDSIENVKIIEVKTLDNDSTVSLFYRLISE